jgi:hypothetical protein
MRQFCMYVLSEAGSLNIKLFSYSVNVLDFHPIDKVVLVPD